MDLTIALETQQQQTATEMSWDLGCGKTPKKHSQSESRHWERGGIRVTCREDKLVIPKSSVPCTPATPGSLSSSLRVSCCSISAYRSPSYSHPGIKSQLLLAPPFSHAPDALIFQNSVHHLSATLGQIPSSPGLDAWAVTSLLTPQPASFNLICSYSSAVCLLLFSRGPTLRYYCP